jgi:hypothetical protein
MGRTTKRPGPTQLRKCLDELEKLTKKLVELNGHYLREFKQRNKLVIKLRRVPVVAPAAEPLPAESLPAEPLPAEPLPAEPLPEPLPAEPLPAEEVAEHEPFIEVFKGVDGAETHSWVEGDPRVERLSSWRPT